MTPNRPLPVAPYRLTTPADGIGARTLTVDETGRRLETWRPLGRGRFAVTLLRERQRWATSGERSDFGRYWNRILREVGRPAGGPSWLGPVPTERLRPGARFAACARIGEDVDPESGAPTREPDAASTPPATTMTRAMTMTMAAVTGSPEADGGQPLPLRPDGRGGDRVCVFGWPAEAGWHRLRLHGPEAERNGAAAPVLDELLVRVYAPTEWTTDRAERRQRATLERAQRTPGQTARRTVSRSLSPWWAWSLLLLAAGLLWLERRWDDLG